MSSTSLNTIFSYNDSLSHQTPVQYLLSLLKFPKPQTSTPKLDQYKQLLLQSAPLAFPSRISEADLAKLERLKLPNSAETFLSVYKSLIGLFVGLHAFALVRPDIKTFSCKMANARFLYRRLWLPFGVLDFARRYWTREQQWNEIESRYEVLDQNVRGKEIEQLLWKEKSWINKLRKDFESKLAQVNGNNEIRNFRSPQGDLMKAFGGKKEEIVDIKELPREMREQVEQAEKEIKKEKNYLDSAFININDILEEIEGTEIIFIHK